MKRIMLKFATLFVLVAAGFLIQDNTPVKATSCWEAAYSKWQGCENGYSTIKYNHIYADSNCVTQATNECASDPNPSACYSTQYSACIAAEQSTYDNRGFTYADCMGSENTGATCVEQLEGTCSLARDRAATCSSLYNNSDDFDAYFTCYSESGISACE